MFSGQRATAAPTSILAYPGQAYITLTIIIIFQWGCTPRSLFVFLRPRCRSRRTRTSLTITKFLAQVRPMGLKRIFSKFKAAQKTQTTLGVMATLGLNGAAGLYVVE